MVHHLERQQLAARLPELRCNALAEELRVAVEIGEGLGGAPGAEVGGAVSTDEGDQQLPRLPEGQSSTARVSTLFMQSTRRPLLS